MDVIGEEKSVTEKWKPKFEPLVLLMFLFFILGLGFVNAPLGHYVIKKIKGSNNTLRGLCLAKLFCFCGWIFVLGLLAFLISKII